MMKKTMRKRKTRKRTGIRLLSLLALALLCIASLAARERSKAYAVVAGTVFREPGFVLPNAEVELRMTVAPLGVKRAKTLATRSDGRGEYAFRLPAGKAEYAVSVKADGFISEEKPAKIELEERVDIYFTLRAVK